MTITKRVAGLIGGASLLTVVLCHTGAAIAADDKWIKGEPINCAIPCLEKDGFRVCFSVGRDEQQYIVIDPEGRVIHETDWLYGAKMIAEQKAAERREFK